MTPSLLLPCGGVVHCSFAGIVHRLPGGVIHCSFAGIVHRLPGGVVGCQTKLLIINYYDFATV